MMGIRVRIRKRHPENKRSRILSRTSYLSY